MTTVKLPVFPTQYADLSNTISVCLKDDIVYYFNGLHPIYNHASNDLNSFRVITSQLYSSGYCKQSQIVSLFHVTPESVKRAYKKYFKNGPSSLFEGSKSDKSRARVLTEAVLKKAQSQLDEGIGKKDVARNLNIKIDTFNKAILSGRLSLKKKEKTARLIKVNEVL